MKAFIAFLAIFASALAAPSSRIAGGDDAERNQFPYQVSLQRVQVGIWQHVCGGSVITENLVVTAGHCINEAGSIEVLRVRVGLLLLSETTDDIQTSSVSEAIIHEDYAGGVGPYDLAVVRLSTPLTWSDAVQPIALPEANSAPTGNAILSGWGSISTTIIPTMPNQLQTVTVPVLSYEVCANALIALFGSSAPLTVTDTCTGPLTGGIAACRGDSGGPLAQNGELIGVVSWGITPCGSVGAPSVYVQVSSFVDWITDKIN